MGFFRFTALVLIVSALGAQERQHLVQPGDTVFSLARLYGTTVEEMLTLNNLTDATRVRSGSVLRIPRPKTPLPPPVHLRTHTVEPGETIFSLARRYRLTPEALMRLNGLDDPRKLRSGMVLRVVVEESAPENTQPTDAHPPIARKLPIDSVPAIVRRPLPGLTFRVPGAEFRAVTSGIVVHRDLFRGVGNLLLVDAGNGLVYGYAGWETSSVSLGQRVEAGERLGRIATDPPGSLLYFVYFRTTVVEPDRYFTVN